MKTPNPTPKAKTCQVNRPRWAALIPDQKPCTKEVSKPSAALCARHEKLLPTGWRKLDAEYSAARVATATKPRPKAASSRPLSAKARRDEYAAIVARIEAEGATTSDAQAAADVEVHERGICDPKACSIHRAAQAKVVSEPPVSGGS